MLPNHLPRRQLIRPMPRLEINAFFVILNRVLDKLEERIRLILINAYVVADNEHDFPDLLFAAVLVVLLVLVD